MKPIIKKKLAVFHPQGFLDGGNAGSVIGSQGIATLGTTKCEIVLVSLKKIIFFNRRGLATVLESLNKISNQIGAMIGFCDYDVKKYKIIMDMYNGHVPFSLFDNEQIAALFAGSFSVKNPENCTILVFNENSEQTNQIVMELYERGYKPTIAKSFEEYKELKANNEFLLRYSYLGTSQRAIQIHIKDNVIIYTLKDFLDSSLADDFDMGHHENALKIGFHYFLFDARKVASTNIHAINFLSKISTAGAEYGATIAICGLDENNITDALKQDLEDSGVLLYDSLDGFFGDEEIFGEDGGGALSGKPRHITKKLVGILPLVMETATKTVEAMTHNELIRKDVQVQSLNIKDGTQTLAVAIAFYGNIEGMMVLAMHKDVATNACSVLLDDNSNEQALLEATGELANIIGGKIAQQMKRKNQTVEITMPRTYKDIKELLNHKKGTKGAQIDFEMDGKPVVLFLTK